MSHNPYENYVESQVLSASAVELVTLLYRAAIDSLEVARRHLSSGDSALRGKSAGHAIDVVAELTQALDRERGGDLARNLLELYDYILRRIHHANFNRDDAAFQEVIRLLSTLLEGWQSIKAPTPSPGEFSADQHQPIQCSF